MTPYRPGLGGVLQPEIPTEVTCSKGAGPSCIRGDS